MGDTFDLVVIGGGSGGVRAARMAAQYGARVAVVEEYRYGGTCVIRGCVPKKLFVYASGFSDLFDLAPSFGWSVDATFDWKTLKANKDREIDRLEAVYERLLEGSGVEVIHDRAVLTGPNSMNLKQSGRTLEAKHVLIATGATPFVPNIKGAKLGITSNEVFEWEALPKSLLVEGAGYVALEFASLLAGLGVKVTVCYRRDNVLRGFDNDLRDGVRDGLKARGVDFRFNSVIRQLDQEADGICALFEDGSKQTFDAVLFGTGRKPNVADMGLEAAGVELTQRGAIRVDDYSRTSVANIYAVGDVTDRAQLTPVAIREGSAFAETVFNDNPSAVDHSLIASAVFTIPEAATIGLSEQAAADQAKDFEVYFTRFRPMMNTLSDREDRMMLKLITEPDGGKVLGAHMLGPGAAEAIQLLAVPMGMGATKADLNRAIAVHPTAAEEWVTFKAPNCVYRNGQRAD